MLFQYTERMFLAWSSETESHVLMTQIANKDWPIPMNDENRQEWKKERETIWSEKNVKFSIGQHQSLMKRKTFQKIRRIKLWF